MKYRTQANSVIFIREFFGRAHFHHPSPASTSVLATHFPSVDPTYTPIITPSTKGETIPGLHNRLAFALRHIVQDLDNHPAKPRSVLICSHAATIIAIGRVLTGRMPEDESEHDFDAFTCGLSKFNRRVRSPVSTSSGVWNPSEPDRIPDVEWRTEGGLVGGWDCELNSDCSFLVSGQENGWYVSCFSSHRSSSKTLI
jgi:transcription factor C subunit 7